MKDNLEFQQHRFYVRKIMKYVQDLLLAVMRRQQQLKTIRPLFQKVL